VVPALLAFAALKAFEWGECPWSGCQELLQGYLALARPMHELLQMRFGVFEVSDSSAPGAFDLLGLFTVPFFAAAVALIAQPADTPW